MENGTAFMTDIKYNYRIPQPTNMLVLTDTMQQETKLHARLDLFKTLTGARQRKNTSRIRGTC
jgi:hypothetical protein